MGIRSGGAENVGKKCGARLTGKIQKDPGANAVARPSDIVNEVDSKAAHANSARAGPSLRLRGKGLLPAGRNVIRSEGRRG